MFTLPGVFFIALATGVITNQVTKHGWKGFAENMIDHDEVKPKPKHQPKHAKKVYDWEHDAEFKKSLDERKSA